VTEAEWLDCQDDYSMLLSVNRDLHARKLRLFACACARRLWRYINDERSRYAVEVAEHYADNLATRQELAAARERAGPAATSKAKIVAFHAASDDACWAAGMAAMAASLGSAAIKAGQAAMLHDLFGNPFRPVVVPASWLAWEGGTIGHLAQAVYDERSFDRLPILADALEEAGCADGRLLHHLHNGGEHFRGCWALDALLGKE
jgi:hypothetical protein